jgi:1-phosphatidylinositol-5-phosphate 4-kinase
LEEDDDSESGSGLDTRGGGGERWGWGGAMATPPDSPHALALMRETSLQYETGIVPELDIYAIPSSEGTISYTVKPLFIVFVGGLEKKQWIRENNRCGSHS